MGMALHIHITIGVVAHIGIQNSLLTFYLDSQLYIMAISMCFIGSLSTGLVSLCSIIAMPKVQVSTLGVQWHSKWCVCPKVY